MKIILLILCFASSSTIWGQYRWMQRAEYVMDITLNVENHHMSGTQELVYFNNSPDTLQRAYYHLYFNAFQPNSMMDVRSRTIVDPDPRVGHRIANLEKDEMGYLQVNELKQNGQALDYAHNGTILEVILAEPILPGDSAVFNMVFEGQVPIQIRRNGRDNEEGIAYSMAQWYPKMCEYDDQGWHANPYVGREFYGIWGDFKVAITIDASYVVGAGAVLVDSEESDGMRTSYWEAENVHDFMWAADPDYKHVMYERKDGVEMHFYYQPGEDTEAWERLPEIMDVAFDYIEQEYGAYPYPVYAFIQGGDGGMEYPMGTLITGHRNLRSLVGVSVHELFHSWYQMVLATNESLHAWMDEGFTSYGSAWTMNYLTEQGFFGRMRAVDDPILQTVAGYVRFNKAGIEEPLSTHADHFQTNTAYARAAYTKGSVFLHQIRYITGDQAFRRIIKRYYNTWMFHHPRPNDFIRIAEKETGLELDWFREYFEFTTYVPDYAVDTLEHSIGGSIITLSRRAPFPMPVDVRISTTKGEDVHYTIPLRIMRGAKEVDGQTKFAVAEDWPWTHPTYQLEIPIAPEEITEITIDSSQRMMDMDRENNVYTPR